MVFVTAGEGGGTGTGGAPVVAKIAKGHRRPDHRRRDPAVHLRGTSPGQPGRVRHRAASARRSTPSSSSPTTGCCRSATAASAMLDAFRSADQVLLSGVQGITDLITTPGLINLDFADVKSVMQGAGSALMGIGSARGEDRAVQAAELAISSPLLEASIDGAHGVLLSIQGGVRPRPVRDQRGRPAGPGGGPPRGQHHLRRGHRRRPRRRGAGHRHRGRVRRRRPGQARRRPGARPDRRVARARAGPGAAASAELPAAAAAVRAAARPEPAGARAAAPSAGPQPVRAARSRSQQQPSRSAPEPVRRSRSRWRGRRARSPSTTTTTWTCRTS